MNSKLEVLLRGSLDEYKSIPFWSWNSALEPAELIRQIDDMKAAQIGGFIIHARTGLREEYLGEKWFHCIRVCLDRARELGMQAWIYDENGWPSGFVGGKLLENAAFRARFLEYSVGAYDETAFASFVAEEPAGYRRVTGPVPGAAEYHNVYLRVSPANTDILNPEVVDAFLEQTHEQYYRRFSERFGRELAGFFTDEPQFYRWATPYSPMAEEIFTQAGRDIRDGLIWLFCPDPRGYEFRQKYYEALNRLYVTNFYQRIHSWCRAHHCLLTGHSIEEGTLYGQMWGGGAVMPTYAHEDIPAIDSLGRSCLPELGCRQVASVAAQLGKTRILTETFACSGYDVTPRELKSIAQSQYFQGVNMMCQHLYPYSIAGQGRIDHPPVFSPHSNWFSQFGTFNQYFNRLGAIVANTREQVDIAILHPIREIWLHYTRAGELESVAPQEAAFETLLTALRKRGISYHLLDEGLLAELGSVEDGRLRVGAQVYDSVLIPEMQTVTAPACRLLAEFTGRLCVLGQLQYVDGVAARVPLVSNCTLEQLLDSGAVGFRCDDSRSFLTRRGGEIGQFLFVKNDSMTESSHVMLENVAEQYVCLELETLTEEQIGNELFLGPGEGKILLRSPQARPTRCREQALDVTDRFRVSAVTDNYLVLDRAELARDGGAFGPEKPIVQLFEELLREDYRGELTVRQRFVLREPCRLTLLLEKADFLELAVNGLPVEPVPSDFDVNFVEAALSHALVAGENILTYRVNFWQHEGVHFALFDPLATESLRNCLYYDTSIEPAYLRGEFRVNEDLSLNGPGALALSKPLDQQGYPFFSGRLTLRGSLSWQGTGQAVLELEGRYLVARLLVNGVAADMVLADRRDITALLCPGENDIEIQLHASLRNLLGPHHYRCDGDVMWVSPGNFHFRGSWEAGEPEEFTPEYRTVPFGLNRIRLITRQEA